MRTITSSAPVAQEIVAARCENLGDTQAITRWILPVLQEWPQGAWYLWQVNASDCAALQATRITAEDCEIQWQVVACDAEPPQDDVCRLLGGHFGIVILAHHLVAAEAARKLEGLVSHLMRFPASSEFAKPLARSFASFGVKLAA
jgi:hypothetical protein